ncbi:MAG: glycosyltransferase family 2 protein [Brucella sp.]
MLSVIIPAFNASKTIIETLNSLYRNIKSSFEVIIVDDNSTDTTVETIKNFIRHNSKDNVRVLVNEINCGPGVSRDLGLTQARGDFILFFDGDDILRPHAVDTAVSLLAARNLDVVLLPYNIIYGSQKTEIGMWEPDKAIFDALSLVPKAEIRPAEFPTLLSLTNYPWNKIARKSFLEEIDFSFGALRLHEDIMAHWQILINAEKVLISNIPICDYYYDPNGSSATNNKTTLRLQVIDALRDLYAYLTSNDKFQFAIPTYIEFSVNLISWAYTNIHSEYREEFTRKARDLLLEYELRDLQIIFHSDRNVYGKIYSILVRREVK